MSLKKELDKLKTDKRLTNWHISRGKLKKSDHLAQLAALEDCADNVYNEADDNLDDPGDFGDDSLEDDAPSTDETLS